VSTDLVRASPASAPATGNVASLPVLVERAGGAARFAWDEFFYAEHHNSHTQEAYMRAVQAIRGLGSGDRFWGHHTQLSTGVRNRVPGGRATSLLSRRNSPWRKQCDSWPPRVFPP
jgi:hypothetical protein